MSPFMAAQADEHREHTENRLIEKGERLAKQGLQVIEHGVSPSFPRITFLL